MLARGPHIGKPDLTDHECIGGVGAIYHDGVTCGILDRCVWFKCVANLCNLCMLNAPPALHGGAAQPRLVSVAMQENLDVEGSCGTNDHLGASSLQPLAI